MAVIFIKSILKLAFSARIYGISKLGSMPSRVVGLFVCTVVLRGSL